jgi:predicted transcriptional regulator
MDREAAKRRYFQQIKTMSLQNFWIEQDRIHARAYELAVKHYQEALSIVLQPKQKAAVIAKAEHICRDWDGIGAVTVDETEANVG